MLFISPNQSTKTPKISIKKRHASSFARIVSTLVHIGLLNVQSVHCGWCENKYPSVKKKKGYRNKVANDKVEMERNKRFMKLVCDVEILGHIYGTPTVRDRDMSVVQLV